MQNRQKLEIEYITNLYLKISNNLKLYIKHIDNIIELSYINGIGSNSSVLNSAAKYSIYFKQPQTISNLWNGEIGIINMDTISIYYLDIINCELYFQLNYINLVETKISFNPNENSLINTIGLDEIIKFKFIITQCLQFYVKMIKNMKKTKKQQFDTDSDSDLNDENKYCKKSCDTKSECDEDNKSDNNITYDENESIIDEQLNELYNKCLSRTTYKQIANVNINNDNIPIYKKKLDSNSNSDSNSFLSHESFINKLEQLEHANQLTEKNEIIIEKIKPIQ